MRIFGQADKVEVFQKSVKTESAKLEAVRESKLREVAELNDLAESLKDITGVEATERLATKTKDYQKLLVTLKDEQRRIESETKAASKGFEATQKRLLALQDSLEEREAFLPTLRAETEKALAEAKALKIKAAKAQQLADEELMAVRVKTELMSSQTEESLARAKENEAVTATARKRAEELESKTALQLKEVEKRERNAKLLVRNVTLREEALDVETKKLASRAASLATAYKEMYGKS